MAAYRLYYLTPAGKLIRRDTIEAEDDDDAIAKMEKPGEQCMLELWLGGRMVHRKTTWPATKSPRR